MKHAASLGAHFGNRFGKLECRLHGRGIGGGAQKRLLFLSDVRVIGQEQRENERSRGKGVSGGIVNDRWNCREEVRSPFDVPGPGSANALNDARGGERDAAGRDRQRPSASVGAGKDPILRWHRWAPDAAIERRVRREPAVPPGPCCWRRTCVRSARNPSH